MAFLHRLNRDALALDKKHHDNVGEEVMCSITPNGAAWAQYFLVRIDTLSWIQLRAAHGSGSLKTSEPGTTPSARLGKQWHSLTPNATIDDDLRAAACLGTKL